MTEGSPRSRTSSRRSVMVSADAKDADDDASVLFGIGAKLKLKRRKERELWAREAGCVSVRAELRLQEGKKEKKRRKL